MESRPLITCFDLAGRVGVCTGRVGDQPRLETWRLIGKDRPEKLAHLDSLLEQHFASHDIDLAYYEAPLAVAVLMKIGAREETIQLLRSAVAVLETICAKHHIPVASWAVQQARRGVLGYGTFPKGTAKVQVMRLCRMLGYAPKTDHEADALIGWLFKSALLNPRWASVQGPLFASAR
jgi:Holliday junction resolvasome RuvABC endonuclease subunit